MKNHPASVTLDSAAAGGVTKGSVAQDLRARIVAGEFPPGSRLPPRSTLEQFFGTTKVTVQRAFNDLHEDGFISVKGKQGTFVAEAPPHLTRYGLLFPAYPESWSDNRFWLALAAESAAITRCGPRTITCFFGLQEGAAPPDRERLHHEIHTHQLAGVIYVYNPGANDIETQHLLDRFEVPRIAITLSRTPIGMPAVSIDYFSFIDGALDEIAAQGKKRVAIMVPNSYSNSGLSEYFLGAAARRGLTTQPYWCLPMSLQYPANARIFTHLLMHSDQGTRPEALVVADDNLLDDVVQGLRDAGLGVPEDLLIVGHINFPAPPAPYHGAIRLLGFDVPEILSQCLDLLDRQRSGDPVPAVTPTRATFGETAMSSHAAPERSSLAKDQL